MNDKIVFDHLHEVNCTCNMPHTDGYLWDLQICLAGGPVSIQAYTHKTGVILHKPKVLSPAQLDYVAICGVCEEKLARYSKI